MRKFLFLCLAVTIPLFSFSQNLSTDKAEKTKHPKRFQLPDELEEVSGLYYQAPDKFWWHNDSGGEPALYITDKKGKLTKTIFLNKINPSTQNVKNKDWEDITCDDKGNIYIGEFGNNRNKRKDLKIFIFHPENNTLDSISYSYPDQELFPPASANRNFNMEGFFWFKNKLHLFSKNKLIVGDYYTKHYILDDQPGKQKAVLHNRIFLKDRVVTAAAISPDGKSIALLSYIYKKRKGLFPKSKASVFVFRDYEDFDFFNGKMKKQKVPAFIVSSQYESLDFLDNKYILIASEKTKFVKQKAKRLKIKFK